MVDFPINQTLLEGWENWSLEVLLRHILVHVFNYSPYFCGPEQGLRLLVFITAKQLKM